MSASTILTYIPARLDRLSWTRFHWQILIALGITWILDGLEVTFIGAVGGMLQHPATLGLSASDVGLLGTAYVLGAVIGALFFGYLTDRMGRKKLFLITLAVYIVGVLASAWAWNLESFFVFRFLTGAGIGGEYAAINSAIDELIPARVRGQVGLTLNGTYWLGAAIGALSTVWLLDPQFFSVDVGWRVGFAVGGVLGLVILLFRRFLPESPRWLVLRGREKEAEEIVRFMEEHVAEKEKSTWSAIEKLSSIEITPQSHTSLKDILSAMVGPYRQRSILGLSLMGAQAFLYNAIFFTYALVLTQFYNVAPQSTGLYILPFAIGNFLGPVLLGPLFDSIGRRKMITFTYAISALLLVITGILFNLGWLNATTQTLCWSVVFFFASAAASSAYLTVSEIFPLESRALAIAVFYALGTGVGGALAPWLFGALTESGSRLAVFYGYLLASILMWGAAWVEWKIGLDSERKTLEEISLPLSSQRNWSR